MKGEIARDGPSRSDTLDTEWNYGGAATPTWSSNKSNLVDQNFNDMASSVY
ncbi:hypothetical protein [Microbacterium sp.]|uniref:hypothetical protein n=1 Tax=Microbacterium sp. TaxID=51671 RepID=UPI0039E3B286